MSKLSKLLCALMCICIIISCFPLGVFAKPGGGAGDGGGTTHADPGVTDGNFIRVRKTFDGLTDETKIPSTFKITVTGGGSSYELKITDIGVVKTNTATSLTYTWTISGVGPGTYKVSEVGADNIDKYDLTGTTGLGSVEVKAGDFIIFGGKATECNHTKWPVDITGDNNFLFAAALTGGAGCVVISKEPLSTSQQLKVTETVTGIGGNWKTPVYFYSIATNGNGPWTVSGKELKYNESDGEIELKTTSAWSHVATLSYKVTDASNPEISITNEYTPNTIDIPVEKVWIDDTVDTRPASVTIKLLAGGTETGDKLTLTAAKDWKDSFKDVPKKDASGKAIVYTVSEDTSDTSVFGSGEGKYARESITGTAETGFIVTNKYTPVPPPPPKPSTVTISGTKKLEGKTLAADDFTFSLSEKDGPEVSTVKNDEDGKFSFTFTPSSTPGNYIYEVAEKDEGKAGITYDTTKYVVYVTVGLDGKPEETTITRSDDKKTVTSLDFTNTYAPTPTSVTLTGSKTLSCRTLKDDEFSFVLKDKDTAKEIQTVTNTAGSFAFKEIKYTAPGTYTYTVSEKIPADADKDSHIAYDTSVYTIEVVVTDKSGKLEAATTIKDKDDKEVSSIAFVNTYTPDAVNAQFSGEKKLEGKTLAAGDFSFTLSEDEKVIQTVTNAADGSFSFDPISYTTPGTHTYTVAEVDTKDSHITYDTSVYTITVAVEKNADGTLSKTETIKKGDDETVTAITFTNTYTAPYIPPVHDDDPTVITIKVRKTWDDSDNTYGIRPDTITVRLFADGVEKGHKTMTKDDGWKEISFTVAYKSGTKYEVKEDAVPGYLTTITGSEKTGGFDIVNKYDGGMGGTGGPGEDPDIPADEEPGRGGTDEKTEISVTKVWSDKNNAYRKRPSSITVKLYANGKDSGKELSLTSAAGWKGSFTELPVYDEDDALIVYTVKEVAVSGYTSKVTGDPENGFTITNTIKNTNVPKTGDNSRPALWTGLLLASALGFAAAAFGGKKTGRKKSR